MDYSADRNQAANAKPPRFRNFHFRNISGTGAPTAILLEGLADSPIENISFDDLTLTTTKGVVANHVRGLAFNKTNLTPAAGPVFSLDDANNVTVRASAAPADTEIFLSLAGKGSGDVRIENCDLTAARQKFAASAEVPANAIVVR